MTNDWINFSDMILVICSADENHVK